MTDERGRGRLSVLSAALKGSDGPGHVDDDDECAAVWSRSRADGAATVSSTLGQVHAW